MSDMGHNNSKHRQEEEATRARQAAAGAATMARQAAADEAARAQQQQQQQEENARALQHSVDVAAGDAHPADSEPSPAGVRGLYSPDGVEDAGGTPEQAAIDAAAQDAAQGAGGGAGGVRRIDFGFVPPRSDHPSLIF
jgi:type II secretory pathway pseudopilin PulG